MSQETVGPRLRTDDGRMIPNFVSRALSGRPLTVYGDGSQTRIIQYDLGNPTEHTVGEIAELVIGLSGGSGGTTYEPLPEDYPRQRCPDITRARETLD